MLLADLAYVVGVICFAVIVSGLFTLILGVSLGRAARLGDEQNQRAARRIHFTEADRDNATRRLRDRNVHVIDR